MKLLSYYDLILEKALNESVVYYSVELKNILNKMKNNKIAKELLDIEYKDIKPDVTFLDLTDKDGYLSFTTMKNAMKKLKDKFIANDTIENIEKGNFSGAAEVLKRNDDTYGIFSKSRNPVKIGKLINKIFPGKFSDAEKEEFVNKFKAKVDGKMDTTFKIIEGDDIAFWYNYKNYSEEEGQKGQLWSSCMRGNDYFDIYKKNPDVCRMLILIDDEEKLLGRALIWKINSIEPIRHGGDSTNFEYFLDRQYTILDHDVEKFRDYAKKEGWAYKSENNHHSFYSVNFEDKNYYLKMEVVVKQGDYNNYPYLDTFRMYDPSDGTLSNDGEDAEDNESYEGWYILDSTGGGYTEVESGVWSEYHDRRIPEDEAVYTVDSDWVLRDEAVEVENGWRGHHGWYPDDHYEIIYDGYNNYHIHREDTTYCDDYDESIDSDTAVNVITDIGSDGDVYSTSYYWEDDTDIYEIDTSTEWYIKLSEEFSDWDESYINKDLLTKNYLGDYFPTFLAETVYSLKEPIDDGKTQIEELREVDAKILGYEIDKSKSYVVDKVSYYSEINSLLKDLYNKSKSYYDNLVDQINDKGQLRMKFSEEDHENWKNELKKEKQKVYNLMDDIEEKRFLEIDFEI